MLPISENNPKELIEKIQDKYNEASILKVESGLIHYVCGIWIGVTSFTLRFEVPVEKSFSNSFRFRVDAKDLLEFRTQ